MSKIFQSDLMKAGASDLAPGAASDTPAVKATWTTSEAIAVNHVCELFVLPPYCEVVDLIVDSADLDTGAAVMLAVGIMKGNPGDLTFANRTTANLIGAEYVAASNVGQAGGLARMNAAGALRVAASDSPRAIGIQATTAPGTSVAAGAKVTVQALIRSVDRMP